MKPLDKNYLTLQFKNRIYSKIGIEFQSFFENIMEKAYPDFQKIRPYGNIGDRGNDGFRKQSGIYYQVYAPETPVIKHTDAAVKVKEDFEKLKKDWNRIAKIKEYYFVFNDKYTGTTYPIEESLDYLKKENPEIHFDSLLAKQLEKIFFNLTETDILELNFHIDRRQSLSNAYEYFEIVEIEIDRENHKAALKMIDNYKNIIVKLDDAQLLLEQELIETKCLKRLENVNKALEKYEELCIKYPSDSRAHLNLAEIYLQLGNFEKNLELLEKAEKINSRFWLLKLEKLVRKSHLQEKIEIDNINEKKFPTDPRIKSNFYRLYAHFLNESNNSAKAIIFAKKAIELNPNRFSNHIARLEISEKIIYQKINGSIPNEELKALLSEIVNIEKIFGEYGDIGKRNKSILNIKKINIFRLLEDANNFFRYSDETFDLLLECYFDNQIDKLLFNLLMSVQLPKKDFDRLIQFLNSSKHSISDELSNIIIRHFDPSSNLFTVGKEFFNNKNKKKYINLINNLENKNFKLIIDELTNDLDLALSLATSPKSNPILREKIIEMLPDDAVYKKEKLLLLLNYEEKNYEKAFEILKIIDLSNLNYFECIPILNIAHKKEAWDFEIVILNKLLDKEQNKDNINNLKLKLFNANDRLDRYPEIIRIGIELLEEDLKLNFLTESNKEIIIVQIVSSYLKRNENIQAKGIIEKYILEQPPFEFTIGIIVDVYLKNNVIDKAIEALVNGVKRKKILSHEEYAKLFWYITQIEHSSELNLDSLTMVEYNSFVKLKNRDIWYYIGDDNELDASKISSASNNYSKFIDKKINNNINIGKKFSSDIQNDIIEFIFPIDKYIYWQSIRYMQILTHEERWEGAKEVEVPMENGKVDTQYIEAFLKELDDQIKPFFETYCENNLPFAMLAVSENGFTNAIVRIQNEDKGFINFCSNHINDINRQIETAGLVIEKQLPFYIDGTSAFIFSETGLLKKIYQYIPNLKVPQSVINHLIDITLRFNFIPGQGGYLNYAKGKINYTPVDLEKNNIIKNNFIASRQILESKSENITTISLANKSDKMSEQKIPDYLCDACILSQKEDIPILTDDFLYLKYNELDTNKKLPEHFSSLSLVRYLYSINKLSFDEYLDFFYYLSSYRFRFLVLDSKDIEKAVFGDGIIKIVQPKNIQKLNFRLTLSEQYGVPFTKAFSVVFIFLYNIITDDTITPEIVEQIFVEIIETFPSKLDKKFVGQLFINAINDKYEKSKSTIILNSKDTIYKTKIDKLIKLTDIYKSTSKIITS